MSDDVMDEEGGAPARLTYRRALKPLLDPVGVVSGLVATAILVGSGFMASLLLEVEGRSLLRGVTEFAVVLAGVWMLLESMMVLRSNGRWVRSRRFEDHKYRRTPTFKRLRSDLNRAMLRTLSVNAVAFAAAAALVFAAGFVLLPSLLVVLQLIYYLCLRSKRDRVRIALDVPPMVGWPRGDRSVNVPTAFTDWLLNPRGVPGAPKSVWFFVRVLAFSLPITFAAHDGRAEFGAAWSACWGVVVGESEESVDHRQPDETAATESAPEVMPADGMQPESSARPGNWTVVEGDSFWLIAETIVRGRVDRTPTEQEIAAYWARLVAANEQILVYPGDPDHIVPGQEVQLVP